MTTPGGVTGDALIAVLNDFVSRWQFEERLKSLLASNASFQS